MKRGDVVEVRWLDAYHSDHEDDYNWDGYPRLSVGYLVRKTKLSVTIAQSRDGEHQDQHEHLLTIPLAWVRRCRRVG